MSCHIKHNSNDWNTWEKASSLMNYIAALLSPSKKISICHTHTHTPLYTPISVKVASEKNDAWSMFHSLRCIIVASLVNYVPATSLETKKAKAADAFMLCQQNVKTMYFKTLNHRPFNLRQWFEVRFFSVVICKCCKFSMSLLGPCTWEFLDLKYQIQAVF